MKNKSNKWDANDYAVIGFILAFGVCLIAWTGYWQSVIGQTIQP